jgi:hypothetical protein
MARENAASYISLSLDRTAILLCGVPSRMGASDALVVADRLRVLARKLEDERRVCDCD